jgi:hypothetical protein
METLTMSRKERKRMTVMTGVKREELTLVQAGELMAVCYRQSKRIWRRYQDAGDEGLVHRLRGKPSAWRKPPELRKGVEKGSGHSFVLFSSPASKRGRKRDPTIGRFLEGFRLGEMRVDQKLSAAARTVKINLVNCDFNPRSPRSFLALKEIDATGGN